MLNPSGIILSSHNKYSLGSLHLIKMGKRAGADSMQGERLKYARPKVTGLLPLLFHAMFLHNYLPCKFMETIIVTIMKNKGVLNPHKDNYRPIAITSI